MRRFFSQQRTFRRLFALLLMPLPQSLKRRLASLFLGWELHPSSYIGFSFIDAVHVRAEQGSRIGHLTVLKSLTHVELGESATIGQWNWITASPVFLASDPANSGRLKLGDHSAVTLRHYIDCSGGIQIGQFTTVAGVRSTLLTHQIDIASSRQTTQPITIGNYCFVGSNAKITPGASLPDRTVIGMGAVVVGSLERGDGVYAGVPARFVKDLTGAKYFERERGIVWID